MLTFERIEYTEGMNTLYADNNGKYDKVSRLVGCCMGDFVAGLEMEFGEETDEGVCLFGNPNMCFQTSGVMARGDGGANFAQYALFILNLMQDGFETLNTDEKKTIVQDMVRDVEENGVEHGDVLVVPPANQPIENEFYVRKTCKGEEISTTTVIGYEAAREMAKEKMLEEFKTLLMKDVNVNVAHVKDTDGQLVAYRVNNVTQIVIEKKAA